MTRSVALLILGLTLLSCERSNWPHGELRAPTVALQPFHDFDARLTDSVAAILEKSYGVKTIVLRSATLPKSAFTNVKTSRYRADSLLVYLMANKPDTIDYIIGLTSEDVSTTKRDESGEIKSPKEKYADWGVLGLGYRPGPSCVISTFRVGHKSKDVFMERLKKIAVHELGHNIGLDHCETSDCVMQDAAETIKTIDRSRLSLCAECKKKI